MKNIAIILIAAFSGASWNCNNQLRKVDSIALTDSTAAAPMTSIHYLKARSLQMEKTMLEESMDIAALSKKDLSPQELKDYFGDQPELLSAELKARDTTYGAKAGYTSWLALKETNSEHILMALLENTKSIYGPDDRENAVDIAKLPKAVRAIYQGILPQSKAVCGVFYKADFIVYGQKIRFKQPCLTLEQSMQVCETERFAVEPTSPFCTGFGLAPYRIITAGHCLDGFDPSQFYLIFGFAMTGPKPADYPMEFDLKDVFEIKRIVSEKHGKGSNVDYCVLETNKPLSAERISKYRQTGPFATGERVYVIGHPSGLPLKLSPGANVRGTRVAGNSVSEYFKTNLDTYGGNSGSPVFNENTHEVEGILIRGDDDYVMVNNCKVSLRYANDGGKGEDVVRISNVLPYIK